MRRFLRGVKSSRKVLFRSKMRIILSLVGIAIGITSVVIIVSISEGAKSKMMAQIESMGSNVITIDAGVIEEVVGRKRQANKVTSLKEKDVQSILEKCGDVIAIAPTQEQTLVVKYENASTIARIIGTYPEFPSIRNFNLAAGRFFSSEENALSLRYAVIGHKFVEYLFDDTNPIGQTIKINNLPFEIIGVLKSKGSSYDGANEDDMIFIPLKTGMRRVFNVDYLKNIYVKVNNKENIPSAENELTAVLREQHRLTYRNKENDFTLQNVYTAVKVRNETDESFSILITAVTALSLLVGGVGILATMLLSIKERNPEIGLRMAVGAKTRDILFQFIFEAVILTFIGSAIGIITGIVGAFIIAGITEFAVTISLPAILIPLIISFFIGILFGVYPARKASIIQPVIALKL